jgi:hypothetical protein
MKRCHEQCCCLPAIAVGMHVAAGMPAIAAGLPAADMPAAAKLLPPPNCLSN